MSYTQLHERFKQIGDLNHALGVLSWDDAAMMPVGGGKARSESMATLSGMAHELVSEPVLGEWLQNAEQEGLDTWQRANVREMRREWELARVIPGDLVVASSKAASTCEQAWRKLRAENDFPGVAPLLEEVVRLTRERAECLAEASGVSPYDALLDQYEPGLKQADFAGMFSELAGFLPRFVDGVIARQPASRPIAGPFPIENQAALADRLMRTLGFDFERGRLDTSHHPFCGGDPDDTRITTRYNTDDFLESLFAVLHETGHALYEQGLPADWRRQPVGAAGGMALHESQSLLMEMQACRSPEFLSYAAPVIRECLGATDDSGSWSLGNLLRLATKVERGFIRVEADEATYPLHVILRYELESALVDGALDVVDLPEAWNEKMERYLGLSTAGDDANGCMQDVHWYAGLIGYFPTYTLGALAAAQIFTAARDAIGDVHGELARGDFGRLVAWLRENVHGRGRVKPSMELITEVTGKSLGTGAFLAHLETRYAT